MSGVIQVPIGVIWKKGKILISQRLPGYSYPLHWEFPGGKQEAAETAVNCLKREIMEELGVVISPIEALEPILFPAPQGWLVLKPYHCLYIAGEPRTLEVKAFRWLLPQELSRYKFPPANRSLVQDIASGKIFPAASPLFQPTR